MASLEGFDNNDFAKFDTETPTIQQLPSLPIDNVLPKANKDVEKTVHFQGSEDVIESQPDANLILPSQPSEPESTVMDQFKQFFEEYSPYIFALVFILIAYWYSKKY